MLHLLLDASTIQFATKDVEQQWGEAKRHFRETHMIPRKRLWELQHQTLCKVIGMAFDLDDLKKIARKFVIARRDPLMDHEFALHSTAVQLCDSDNKVARHIEKMIQKRFARYSSRLAALDAHELIESITEGKGNPDIPLWAVLWDLATRGLDNGASLETALFGFIHMLEHRLMREFWDSAARRAEERAEESRAAGEVTRLKRRMLDLQGEVDRSVKLIEQLRTQLAERKSLQALHGQQRELSPSVRTQNVDQAEKIKRLQVLLGEARTRNQELEEQYARLLTEMDVLAREACRGSCHELPENRLTNPIGCPCPCSLKQKHIAMVGGIDSLETHYRELVEEMGGTFQRHDGDCRGGEYLIHDYVRRADLVVCPIEVNSHNAVKSVKRLCKKYGVPCCFPRTAGLSGFRTAIEEHFSEPQVA